MIQISDYPKQCEFESQVKFESVFNKMVANLKDGSIAKYQLRAWKAQNEEKLKITIHKDSVDTLRLQNSVYDELLSMEIE